METSTMIRQLRRIAKKHENDKLLTFATDITAMCTDVANRLEELEKKNKEIRAKAIDEFASFMSDYINENQYGCVDDLLDRPYTTMLEIAEQLKAGVENG